MPQTEERNSIDSYLCGICRLFPIDPRWCRGCNTFFCRKCLTIAIKYGNRCIRIDGVNSSHTRHIEDAVPPPTQFLFNNKYRMLCEYGCLDSQGNRRSFKYKAGDRHNSGRVECPNKKCERCGMYKTTLTDGYKHTEAQCIEALKGFAEYIEARRL